MEKEGIREIPIRCWKVAKAARYKAFGGVEVHILTADTLNQNEEHTWEQSKLMWDRKRAGTETNPAIRLRVVLFNKLARSGVN